jgi:UDP-N-acetylmuramoylalanine--D-glutamate ligase
MTVPERVGVLGLARSGRAAARLALASGMRVFASDFGENAIVLGSAAEVRRLGGEAETGGHSVDRLAECDLVVVSPGVPPMAPVVQELERRGVTLVSELEFAWLRLDRPVTAVTGTNGKTTVTAWITHMMRESGIAAVSAGNIGTALSEVALREPVPDYVVVEASSYQLGRIQRFEPQIGVVTNLAPDHLDRYLNLDDYYGDKARLFANATPESTWVLNGDDPAVERMAGSAPGRRLYFRVATKPGEGESGGWLAPDGTLMLRVVGEDEALVREDDLRLLGGHNRANALAAAIAAYAALSDAVALRAGLRSFPPLPHRLEPLGEVDGVLWINDSKATNVASARVAVRSMDRPTILLLGGRPKGESFAPLAEVLRGTVETVIAYGEAAGSIELDLAGTAPVEIVEGPFRNAVRRAAALATPGSAVLLAPACASFDMFTDYEERGREFVRLAGQIVGLIPGAVRG